MILPRAKLSITTRAWTLDALEGRGETPDEPSKEAERDNSLRQRDETGLKMLCSRDVRSILLWTAGWVGKVGTQAGNLERGRALARTGFVPMLLVRGGLSRDAPPARDPGSCSSCGAKRTAARSQSRRHTGRAGGAEQRSAWCLGACPRQQGWWLESPWGERHQGSWSATPAGLPAAHAEWSLLQSSHAVGATDERMRRTGTEAVATILPWPCLCLAVTERRNPTKKQRLSSSADICAKPL